jgi:hypothetical protein
MWFIWSEPEEEVLLLAADDFHRNPAPALSESYFSGIAAIPIPIN